MRFVMACACGFLVSGFLVAKPNRPDIREPEKTPAFKPVAIDGELTANDPIDPEIKQPAKKYTINFTKDQTYVLEVESNDFAAVRLLNKDGKGLAAGMPVARMIWTATASDEHQIVVTTIDGNLGKFKLTIRTLNLRGEAMPREIGRDGLTIHGKLGNQDMAGVGRISKLYSVRLSEGQTYILDMISQDLDSYLYVFDARNKLLAQDDDSGGGVSGLDARITFRAPADGVYHLLATSFGGDETGAFILRVNRQ